MEQIQGRTILYGPTGNRIGAIVPVCDLERLENLDANARDRMNADRRGEPWETWEDELMLEDGLDEEELATRTKRTVKSVCERRRWIRRIAAAKGDR